MNVNSVFIVGRLTKDIELQTTKNKTNVTSFTVAINDGYGDKATVEYIDCVAWKGIADFLNRNAKKGDIVGVEGKLSNNFYESDGKSIKKTEVICKTAQLIKSKTKEVITEQEETQSVEKQDKTLLDNQDEPPF